jgi:hypothetical protein
MVQINLTFCCLSFGSLFPTPSLIVCPLMLMNFPGNCCQITPLSECLTDIKTFFAHFIRPPLVRIESDVFSTVYYQHNNISSLVLVFKFIII